MTELDAATVTAVQAAIRDSLISGGVIEEDGYADSLGFQEEAEAAVRTVLGMQRPCPKCAGDGLDPLSAVTTDSEGWLPCSQCQGVGTVGPAYLATEQLEQVADLVGERDEALARCTELEEGLVDAEQDVEGFKRACHQAERRVEVLEAALREWVEWHDKGYSYGLKPSSFFVNSRALLAGATHGDKTP